jgi:hypothetical protein
VYHSPALTVYSKKRKKKKATLLKPCFLLHQCVGGLYIISVMKDILVTT